MVRNYCCHEPELGVERRTSFDMRYRARLSSAGALSHKCDKVKLAEESRFLGSRLKSGLQWLPRFRVFHWRHRLCSANVPFTSSDIVSRAISTGKLCNSDYI
jgi:hypothetical protein